MYCSICGKEIFQKNVTMENGEYVCSNCETQPDMSFSEDFKSLYNKYNKYKKDKRHFNDK